MKKLLGQPLPRRAFLQGAGVALALPFLHAMVPLSALAKLRGGRKLASNGNPQRFMVSYVPNGVAMKYWQAPVGNLGSSLSKTLSPLDAIHDRVLMISGLNNMPAETGNHGGHHERAAAAFLAGVTAEMIPHIRAGVSMDQILASSYGRQSTPSFPSLHLGCDPDRLSSDGVSRYNAAYNRTLSWKDADTPLSKIIQPSRAFKALFGSVKPSAGGGGGVKANPGIVDSTLADAKDLMSSLGSEDRHMVGEYLEGLHALETKIQHKTAQFPAGEAKSLNCGEISDYATLLKLQFEIAYYAILTDSTRIITFMLEDEFSTRTHGDIGVHEDHHSLSHNGSAEGQAMIQLINQRHLKYFAQFVQKLQATREGDGNLLDHTACLYGSGMSAGDHHSYKGLPILIVGGEKVLGHRSGRHIAAANGAPLCNLHLTVMSAFGERQSKFGDSTGHLSLS